MLLFSFSQWLLEKVGGHAFEKIAGSMETKAIDKKFKKAVSATSKTLQKKYPGILGGSIDNFFESSEVSGLLIKLLFKDSVVDIKSVEETFDTSTLPKDFILEFIDLLKTNCNNDQELNGILSNNKLFISIIGIGEDANKIAKVSNLSLIEIKEIRDLLEKKYNEGFSIDNFFEKYANAAVKVLSELNFLGLGVKSHIKKNKKKLNDVYVEPKLILNEEKSENAPLYFEESTLAEINDSVSLNHVFQHNSNLVILGNPGSGKSVLVRYLICNILEKNCSQIIDNPNFYERIPFRIELRKYFQYKKNTNNGIVKYFIKSLEIDYGLLNITEKNVESLFKGANILIFFDGLDEIFNASDKIEITEDIETLLNNYQNILTVVTSRIIGYEEAKLSPVSFTEYKILDFNDRQIEEYTNKWYIKEEQDLETRNKEVNEFLRLRRNVDQELVTNPLLLSLIIILFRNNLKLPDSKLEIYQSCTKTLVDKWDLTKDLKIELPEAISKRKETLFADLAFWQYERLSSEDVKITNNLATTKIADSIINKLKVTDDWIHAESLADGFMNYALKRSLYFDNNFTHKTFLEYFTAYWIFSNIEKKLKLDERNEIISKYIDVAFWSIVLELLINMIDQDQADTEIIDSLFNHQIEAKPTGLPFLLEITSFLKNISAETVSNLVDSTINYLVSEYLKKSKKKNKEDRHFYSLTQFINNNDNQLKIFKNVYNKYTRTQLKTSSLKPLLLLYLELIFNHQNDRLQFNENDFYNFEYIEEAINNDSQLYFLDYLVRRDSINFFDRVLHILEKFSDAELFKTIDFFYESFQYEGGYFNQFLHWQLNANNLNSFEQNLNTLFSKGLRTSLVVNYLKKTEQYYRNPDIDFARDKINNDLTHPVAKLILLCVLWWGYKNQTSIGYSKKTLKILKSDIAFKDLFEIEDYGSFFNSALEKLNIN